MVARNKEKLEQLTRSSLEEVFNSYRHEDGYGGWHQFLKSPKIGNVATSQALLLLNKFNEDIETSDAYNFLIKEQQKDSSPMTQGGWTYITNLSDRANTESTCWAVKALLLQKDKFQTEIDTALDWLNFNTTEDETKSIYGWGCLKDDQYRTYSTCIALDVFIEVGKDDSLTSKRALTTLKNSQNADGGWGNGYQTSSTLIHTSITIITLIKAGISPASSHVANGVKWILRVLKAEGYERDILMGYVDIIDLSYKVDNGYKEQRITFYHMPLVYALTALIDAGVNEPNVICQGILSMMETNDHGRWQHPYLPGQHTLWAIYDVLNLFKVFKESKYYVDFDLVRYKSSHPKKYDVIIFTVVPVEFNTLNAIWNFAPKGQMEDYSVDGFWYYEHQIEFNNGKKISCLITMVGSAGDVDCSNACQTAFAGFDCKLAILCGIAAGHSKEVALYDTVISDAIVAYEFQRWEKDSHSYRPKINQVIPEIKNLNTKVTQFQENWSDRFQYNLSKIQFGDIDISGFDLAKSKMKAGIIASGAKLLADGSTINSLRENIPIEKGIIAVEMEGHGFSSACSNRKNDWIVFRGISDYGADDKDNVLNKKLQPLAVASAITSMEIYLEHIYHFE